MKVEVSEDVLAALLEAARRNGDADSLDEAVRLLQVMGQVTCYARARRKEIEVLFHSYSLLSVLFTFSFTRFTV